MNRSLQAKFDRSKRQRIEAGINSNFSRGGAKPTLGYVVPANIQIKVATPGKWTNDCSLSNIKAERFHREDGCRLGSALVYEDFGCALVRAGARIG